MPTLTSDFWLNAMANTVEDLDVEEAAIMVDSDNETHTLLDIYQDENILLLNCRRVRFFSEVYPYIFLI